ncbi:glycoside hydrolase [Martensiomyces pterosporus]|nr:glycoside hydrolase [Martensiomyces pterosporus]
MQVISATTLFTFCLLAVFPALVSSAPAPIPDGPQYNVANVDWSKINWNAIDWGKVFSKAPAPAPAPTSKAPSPPPQSSVNRAPLPPPPAPTSKPSSPPPAPPPPPPKDPNNGGGPSSNRALWGLNYSPYNKDMSCPDLNTVTAQLKKIAAVTSNIRLYATDCKQLANTVEAIVNSNLGMGVHAGIWVTDGPGRMQVDLDEFVNVAKKFKGSGVIKGVSVGNEDISKGMSESKLIGYINQVRSRLKAEGLGSIPVYTTEQDALFSANLAAASDVVQVNIYSMFDNYYQNMDASVQSVLQRATKIRSNIAHGKPVRFGESGWSSSGNAGPCPLSLEFEKQYAQKFRCAAIKAGFEYFYFEAKNADWKTNVPEREHNFGIFDSSFNPKFDFGALNSC